MAAVRGLRQSPLPAWVPPLARPISLAYSLLHLLLHACVSFWYFTSGLTYCVLHRCCLLSRFRFLLLFLVLVPPSFTVPALRTDCLASWVLSAVWLPLELQLQPLPLVCRWCQCPSPALRCPCQQTVSFPLSLFSCSSRLSSCCVASSSSRALFGDLAGLSCLSLPSCSFGSSL